MSKQENFRVAISLRSEALVERSKSKPNSRATWNPQTRQLDWPPTREQLRFLREMSERTGRKYVPPRSKTEASAAISSMIKSERHKTRHAHKRKSEQSVVTSRLPRVELWVDGACQPNPGQGAWAALLRYLGASGDWQERELSGRGPADSTNNRMEITAAIEGLRVIQKLCRVRIFTDSQVLCFPFLRGWKRRANLDLWELLDGEIAKHEVEWTLVKGHDSLGRFPFNERVDRIAESLCAEGVSSTIDASS